MTVSSMTGFARASGASEAQSWQWDLRSVNGKSLELRFRLPSGLEHLELPARNVLSSVLKRGNVQASLTYEDQTAGHTIKIDEAALDQAMAAAQRLRKLVGGSPPNIEALLGLRGIVDIATRPIPEEESLRRDAACLKTLTEAVQELRKARDSEGEKISIVLKSAVSRIELLVQQAADSPARKPDAIRAKLKEQIERLSEASSSLDPARLHQEAMLLATRFDVQEEIDRLTAHISAARDLLRSGEPIGRKFDFLSQEFNREANTLCSKSNDVGLTNIGLELKNVIDQLREQVQNIE